jgi:hypothetical protein
MDIASLLPTLISIIISFLEYLHLRRVLYKEDETKEEELSQLRISLQECESFMREFRCASEFMEKLEERLAQFQNEMDTVNIFVKLENERQAQLENETVSLRTMMNVEDENRAQLQNEMVSQRMIMMIMVDNERDVQLLKEMDSVKTIMKAEDERRVQVQKEKDSTKVIAVENEHAAHSKNEANSGKIDAKRLPSMLTEGIVGGPASRESHLKMGGPRKNCIAASKATVEKENKVPINMERVALALPTSDKAVGAKAVYRSNTHHRPGESRIKTRHQKLDYRKIHAKVNTWRCNKKVMQL